jgi:hypothetical protein
VQIRGEAEAIEAEPGAGAMLRIRPTKVVSWGTTEQP